MKTLLSKAGLLLAVVLMFGTGLVAEIIPEPISKKKSKVELNIRTNANSLKVAECCEFNLEFQTKKTNTLKVLESGYGKRVKLTKIGVFEHHDFRYGKKNVARLIVNTKTNTLILVKYDFK